jgi:glycosyltransferase involved in cell wall biosynthesis
MRPTGRMTDHLTVPDPMTDEPAASLDAGRPSVSVIIPVKDDGAELARCLGALSEQSRIADEILVVDNGSSDASAAVARAAGARLVRCHEPGIPAASAVGYDSATGDLLLRLDADCTPARDWIERICAEFAARPDVAALTGRAAFTGGPEALRGPASSAYLLAYAATTAPALGHLPLFGSNLAMRREAWEDVRAHVHRHDPGVHDDLDLAVHLGERHRIGYLRGATMLMSPRPFGSARSLAERFHRGFRTVLIHWPRDFPPVRWSRLLRRPASVAGRAPRQPMRVSPGGETRSQRYP